MERLCELAAESVSGNGMKDDVFLSEPVADWTFHEEKHRCNHEFTADKVSVIGNVHWNMKWHATNQGARPVDQTRTRLGIKASEVVSVLRHITPNVSNHCRLSVDYSSYGSSWSRYCISDPLMASDARRPIASFILKKRVGSCFQPHWTEIIWRPRMQFQFLTSVWTP